MPTNKKVVSKQGFTLIELLVVISIIAILFGAAAYAFTDAQIKARDGKRKADLAAIQQALEQFKADNGSYPTNYKTQSQDFTISNVNITCTTAYPSSTDVLNWGSSFTCNGKTYMAKLPDDPMNNGYVYKNYEYNYKDTSGNYEFRNAPPGWCQLDSTNSTTDPNGILEAAVKNCSHYTLWTTLENSSDSDIKKTLADPICKLAARYGGIGSRPDQISGISAYYPNDLIWYGNPNDNVAPGAGNSYWNDYWTTENWPKNWAFVNQPTKWGVMAWPQGRTDGWSFWSLEDPDRYSPWSTGATDRPKRNYCVHN